MNLPYAGNLGIKTAHVKPGPCHGRTRFIVVERERLDAIFKELRFSLSGVVDQKDVRRAGAILGTDYLVLGSVSESDGKFLIQARMVNVETGVVAAAASVTMEKSLLLKESEEFYSNRLNTSFSAFLGSTKISDLKLTGTHIGAGARHIFTKHQFIALDLQTFTGDSDQLYKSQTVNGAGGLVTADYHVLYVHFRGKRGTIAALVRPV